MKLFFVFVFLTYRLTHGKLEESTTIVHSSLSSLLSLIEFEPKNIIWYSNTERYLQNNATVYRFNCYKNKKYEINQSLISKSNSSSLSLSLRARVDGARGEMRFSTPSSSICLYHFAQLSMKVLKNKVWFLLLFLHLRLRNAVNFRKKKLQLFLPSSAIFRLAFASSSARFASN